MMQQKLSLFQCLNSTPSRAVGMEEIVRLIRYDSDVANKTENYRNVPHTAAGRVVLLRQCGSVWAIESAHIHVCGHLHYFKRNVFLWPNFKDVL